MHSYTYRQWDRQEWNDVGIETDPDRSNACSVRERNTVYILLIISYRFASFGKTIWFHAAKTAVTIRMYGISARFYNSIVFSCIFHVYWGFSISSLWTQYVDLNVELKTLINPKKVTNTLLIYKSVNRFSALILFSQFWIY